MNRRQLLATGSMAVGGFIVGTGASAPACPIGVSKDKAVKYTGFVINYLKDLRPLAVQLNATAMVGLIDKAIPALEKLKDALEKSDIPTAGNLFTTVRSILGQAATALLQLPESGTRNTIMGILTVVNVTLRTVSLFVEAETPSGAMADATSGLAPGSAAAIRKAFDATRF